MKAPAPVVLITCALYARLDDAKAANALLQQHELDKSPGTLLWSMLRLAAALSAYHGGALFAQMDGEGDPSPYELAAHAVADAAWAGDAKLFEQLLQQHLVELDASELVATCLTYASDALLSVYQGDVQLHDLPLGRDS